MDVVYYQLLPPSLTFLFPMFLAFGRPLYVVYSSTYVLILSMIALLHYGYAGPKEAGLRPLASKSVVLRWHDIF